MASIRSGTIAFGLVAIPVRVYVATHSAQLSFNLLHQGCGARIRQRLGGARIRQQIYWADRLGAHPQPLGDRTTARAPGPLLPSVWGRLLPYASIA